MLNQKIKSYEAMIQSIITSLNIRYDQDDYMQIGRIAVLEGLNKYDKDLTKATEAQFIYTKIKQRLIDYIRQTSRYQSRYNLYEDTHFDLLSTSDDYTSLDFHDYNLNAREGIWLSHALAGYSLQHTAKELGVSLSTCKNIRKSAREKLRILYKRDIRN